MKRALVTGAAARIGREMALYLGQQGYDVAVHYATSRQAAEDVVENLCGMGRHAVALQADLLDEAAVQNLMPAAMQALGGPITCLINNASIFEYDIDIVEIRKQELLSKYPWAVNQIEAALNTPERLPKIKKKKVE